MAEDDDSFETLPKGTRLRIVALICSAAFLVFLLAWLISGGGTEIVSKKFRLHTFLTDSGGIAKDADVMLNGVQVGAVTDVRLSGQSDPTRAVRVDLKIQQKFMSNIPVDSIAAVTATNLVGDEFLNITLGKSQEHVSDNSEIASLIQTGSFNPADLVSSLQTTIQRVDLILTQIQQGNTPLAQLVQGSELYDNLSAQLSTIQKTIRTYASPRSPTGRLLFSEEVYNQIRQPILNIDRALEEMQRSETPAGKFLNDPAQYDNALAQIRKVRASIENAKSGKGSVGPWLTNDDQYRKLQAQIQAIDEQIETLTHGEGAFAQLLQSSQLYDSLNGQSREMRAFLKDFREHPQKYLRIKIF